MRRPRSGITALADSGASVARFRRVNEDKPFSHHDALELPNGQIVLLTSPTEGPRVTVIQLRGPTTSHSRGVFA
jgi:hypothetical protein